MVKSDKPDYVLVYDGEGGVRMAPAGTRIDMPQEGQISWPARPEPPLTLETVTVPRRPAYVLPVVGAACLCLMGLTLGVVARPRLAAISAPKPAPMRPVSPQPDAQMPGAQMKVMVLAPALAPVPAAAPRADRLDVLPASQRPGASVASAPPTPRLSPLKVSPPAPTATDPVIADSPPARPRADADCSGAHSAAEAMVCADPDLARADRRLTRAYRAAARSGVPLGQLRAEQDDWLAIREDAAQRSPRAVAQIYDQRIEELESMTAAAEPR
jgi:uncharacterized protein YecT (DUF1311 family)